MKKILATILALTMIVGMSLTAFAAPVTFTEDTATQEIPLKAEYSTQDTTSYDVVYSVDVVWGDMNFTYQADGVRYGWNDQTFQYNKVIGGATGAGAGWNKESSTITITNRSNTALAIDVNMTAVPGFTVEGQMEVASAVSGNPEQPPQTIITVKAPDAIAATVEGNIVLTITPANS